MPSIGDRFPGIVALVKGAIVHDDNRFDAYGCSALGTVRRRIEYRLYQCAGIALVAVIPLRADDDVRTQIERVLGLVAQAKTAIFYTEVLGTKSITNKQS